MATGAARMVVVRVRRNVRANVVIRMLACVCEGLGLGCGMEAAGFGAEGRSWDEWLLSGL